MDIETKGLRDRSGGLCKQTAETQQGGVYFLSGLTRAVGTAE